MKIAIVKLSALGDIIHGMIALQFIKKYYPESEIDWFIEKRFRGILESNPQIHEIHQVNLKSIIESKSFFLLLKELRKIHKLGKYDLVIDMQNLLKSAVISRLIPSDKTIGLDRNSAREGIASIFYNQMFTVDHSSNVIMRNITIVAKALNIKILQTDIKNKNPFLYSSKKYTFNSISNKKQNIVLVPGASYPSKRYPVKNFSELSTQIDANFLVIWGSEKEKALASEIKDLSPDIHVCEKLSLDGLKSLISQVDLVIGPDSGPTHMAWALNIPSITLFGPTPGYRNTYSTDINKIIESESEVNPYKIDKNDYSINNINVGDILKLAQELLKTS
jgi:heptosyltransferase-1